MGKREESDYGDFHEFTEKDIAPLFPEVELFIKEIQQLIEK